jgi:hypothetical protein
VRIGQASRQASAAATAVQGRRALVTMLLRKRLRLSTAVTLLAGGLLFGSATLASQTRFTALSRESVSAVPNLEIVTLRDTVQGACYLLFVTEPPASPARHFGVEETDITSAAQWRDRRQAEVMEAYEHGFQSKYPGTPPVNVLRYELEALKVQAEYERVVREHELARLEDQLALIAASPKVVSAEPVPCASSSNTPSSPPHNAR